MRAGESMLTLPLYSRYKLPYQFVKMTWAALRVHPQVQGSCSSLLQNEPAISDYTLLNGLAIYSIPPPPNLKFLAEMKSVKTGQMYFYWFLQTMTTFPERQCQETINVCETAVNILRSINLSGTPGDRSLKEPLAS